ncbi:spore germination protein KC [Sporobacter termitidis DSM 10068]|uniref:Spore germination protein KC n=1 Tax=Sporobacter termitidis DSM 10068 TaxID=1123282 RepID=A0A1M5YMZ8_9FIRM|nr:Ger(x)C family spore germination protein [Sporobacter termitidis]SHI13288.1 spore germination protein KC [Sporobacter termitidis DSM 10068]
MKRRKIWILLLCYLLISSVLSGCWNYREVESFAIISGFAVDKKDENYLLTFEIVNVESGKDTVISTKHVTSEGTTVFDAVRKTIKMVGKRLYFSHAEVVILSKEVAEEGIVPILDWVARDAEPRSTLHYLVSKEGPAGEILEQQSMTSDVLAYELSDMLKAQRSLSNALDTEEWQFMRDMATKGLSATLPTVRLTNDDNKVLPEISGAAIFKEDKLVGFIDGEDTMTMMFIKDEIKGGLLVNKEYKGDSVTNMSLEILTSKTKLKPRYADNKITMEIVTETNVAIDENGGRDNYLEGEALAKLKSDFETMLQDNIRNLVKSMQEEYDCDTFGFGRAIKIKLPRVWKQIEPQWSEVYKTVEVEVHSTINIRNTSFESKPVKVGD